MGSGLISNHRSASKNQNNNCLLDESNPINMHKKATTKDQTESDLWISLLNGNKKALASLYLKNHQMLFKYGYRITPKEGFVEDCIQELFLRIWENHNSLSEAKSVKAYLCISMRRTIFKNLRKLRNQKDRNQIYAKEYDRQPLCMEELLIEIENDKEIQEKLNDAIDSLSKSGRKVIYLKYYNGMSNTEIANEMDINRQSVYNHVSEAIKAMQQFVK